MTVPESLGDRYRPVAAGKVTAATGVIVAGFGFVVATHPSAGVFTITVAAVDAGASVGFGTTVGGAAGFVTVTDTSPTTKTIEVFSVAGAAADIDFAFEINRVL